MIKAPKKCLGNSRIGRLGPSSYIPSTYLLFALSSLSPVHAGLCHHRGLSLLPGGAVSGAAHTGLRRAAEPSAAAQGALSTSTPASLPATRRTQRVAPPAFRDPSWLSSLWAALRLAPDSAAAVRLPRVGAKLGHSILSAFVTRASTPRLSPLPS